ncbi:hypothetical protein QYE76_069340 [Lolium multiflorum]|uniref:GH10 domain-containing protein n=1 Tax=Lolium multiflorum TaxID=4521 RepID=A0AAD8SG18_LOLMU|nr:endo-1,4-beta-xylanase 5-like isoform X2 [Lolium rigidum]XP_051182396.1 endo-1,4-beta-xylanase 5-like isoform X2 [Lolium perenne]KAK1651535.1 hypothetical protein QYE76_069340 [Lolium multiflorum]
MRSGSSALKHAVALFLVSWMAHCGNELVAAGPPAGWYDYSAYTDCRGQPEPAQYNGGILRYSNSDDPTGYKTTETGVLSPAFVVYDLNKTTMYTFSGWIKLEGSSSALVTARLAPDNSGTRCIGTVLARSDCWSFLKGGFTLDWPTQTSVIFFQNADRTPMKITVASGSLQPFTMDQWSMHQKDTIRKRRKRMATIHVADPHGTRVVGATVSVQQTAKDFPFGSAIASTILGNDAYQKWFVDRFNAAVFEDELKWYSTEPASGLLRFDVPDQMLAFVRSHRVMVRGHNIFWENQDATPRWVKGLSPEDLRSAVNTRIQSLMTRYRGEFAHWDVNNEMLHYNFYEQRLGPNATADFFSVAQDADPLATLFMNEYNVVETCDDVSSTVDAYVARLKDLRAAGAVLEGIGLEGHFSKPNIPYMRAVLDKLATLNLPIWFTEVDINNKFDAQTQAVYLEQVLREAYAHPAVSGVMLWTALHQGGCYQMCLTDWNLNNLPVGDVVDRLLQEWQTGQATGLSDAHGAYSFSGYLGEFVVTVNYGNTSAQSTFSLSPGDETRHITVQI